MEKRLSVISRKDSEGQAEVKPRVSIQEPGQLTVSQPDRRKSFFPEEPGVSRSQQGRASIDPMTKARGSIQGSISQPKPPSAPEARKAISKPGKVPTEQPQVKTPAKQSVPGPAGGGRGSLARGPDGSPTNAQSGTPVKFDVSRDGKRYEVYKEEVLASHMMKQLTQKYGTRGKSAKFIFLQAFEEEIRGGGKGHFLGKSGPQLGASCFEEENVDSSEAEMDDWMEGEEQGKVKPEPPMSQKELAAKAGNLNFALGEMMIRPAAMVHQSAFVSRLEDQVKHEISRTGCPSPVYEMSWLYEEIRREGLKTGAGIGGVDDAIYDTFSVRDSLEEPEEKMLARLKIYKRAFSALILHFEALRPILRDVKRNYDAMLCLRDRQLREANAVKKNIHHVEQALDKKMALVRYEGFKQLTEMEKQCFLLMRHVDKQDGAIRTMTDILNRLETSLSEEHDLRKDSEDQRKLLILEINEIRRKLGMTPRPAKGSGVITVEDEEYVQEEDVITRDDPLILRTALETTRKNLSDAHHRLMVLEADYADVIPRHEFETLKVTMAELEEEHETRNQTYDLLASQVQGLRDTIESLTGERNALADITKDLRTKATPRPSWEKIADHIEGGLPRWETIYQGKSTAIIVNRLIEELTGKKLSGPPEYITALGLDPSVPRYLRTDTRVRHRQLSRRDVAVICNDIYSTRMDQLELLRRYNEAKEEESSGSYGMTSVLGDVPEEKPNILPFPDYVAAYFEERYHILSLRMEWTYNIIEACKLLGGIDPRLVQFLALLQGRVDEGVYHLFRSQVVLLRDALVKKSLATGHPSGSLQLSNFTKALEETFPEKTEEEIQLLLKAASKQCGVHAEWSILRYITFFVMTDEGLIGEFIDELAKQMDEDRMKYVYEILAQLLSELGVSLSSAEREDDPAGDTDVTMQQIFSAFNIVDPTITDEKIGAAMAWIFLGASSLPGMTPKGIYLVEYIKNHNRRTEYDADEDDDDHDDADFERALRDIVQEDEDEDLSAKARKAKVKKIKIANLRTVVRRLKGGAFLRHGRRYPKESPPPTTNEEGEPPAGAAPEGQEGTQELKALSGLIKPEGAPEGPAGEGRKKSGDDRKKSGEDRKKSGEDRKKSGEDRKKSK